MSKGTELTEMIEMIELIELVDFNSRIERLKSIGQWIKPNEEVIEVVDVRLKWLNWLIKPVLNYH